MPCFCGTWEATTFSPPCFPTSRRFFAFLVEKTRFILLLFFFKISLFLWLFFAPFGCCILTSLSSYLSPRSLVTSMLIESKMSESSSPSLNSASSVFQWNLFLFPDLSGIVDILSKNNSAKTTKKIQRQQRTSIYKVLNSITAEGEPRDSVKGRVDEAERNKRLTTT